MGKWEPLTLSSESNVNHEICFRCGKPKLINQILCDACHKIDINGEK